MSTYIRTLVPALLGLGAALWSGCTPAVKVKGRTPLVEVEAEYGGLEDKRDHIKKLEDDLEKAQAEERKKEIRDRLAWWGEQYQRESEAAQRQQARLTGKLRAYAKARWEQVKVGHLQIIRELEEAVLAEKDPARKAQLEKRLRDWQELYRQITTSPADLPSPER